MSLQPAILFDSKRKKWLKFAKPVQVLSTNRVDEVPGLLQTLQQNITINGKFAAGFISYEAYQAFVPFSGMLAADTGFPLIWFGLYEEPELLDTLPEWTGIYEIGALQPEISRYRYEQGFDHIKHQIEQGYSYQVNQTFRLRANFKGDGYGLFHKLATQQQTNYAAFLDIDGFTIASASPELFFLKRGRKITTKPMKGTIGRGVDLKTDTTAAITLHSSIKDQAENIMIVDMLRNDLGRIATIGSVQVTDLFKIEKYPTVFQMTTTVTAETDAAMPEIISALFPCASITGAPKLSTIKIIDQVETSPRNVYTGAIGFIEPNGDCQFNVAIRSALIDKKAETVTYGVGGGIVWDSTAEAEYAEAVLKARVITTEQSNFMIKEAILWTVQDGFFLLDEHLKRIQNSSKYFDFRFEPRKFLKELNEAVRSTQHKNIKVKVELDRSGDLAILLEPISPIPANAPVVLTLSEHRVDSADRFYYHKTTRWESLFPDRGKDLLHDYFYTNVNGEVTETSRANLVFRKGSKYYTPALTCGLLGGTFRSFLLHTRFVQERVIPISTIFDYDAIYTVNSVRGSQKAIIS